jgi:Lysine-specific metallo-endopeptidase
MARDNLQLRDGDQQSSLGAGADHGGVPGKRTLAEHADEGSPVQHKQAGGATTGAGPASPRLDIGRSAPVSSDVRAFHEGPSGVQAQKTNNAGGSQQLTFTDIDATGKKNLQDAIALARTKVAAAISEIAGARSGPQAKASKYFKITGDKSGDDLKAIDKVIEVFNKVQTALGGNLHFEGEKPDGGTQAYVYTGFIGLFDGAVHIHFPGFNNETPTERAAILIHELSHKYAGTDDNAYLHETGKWAKMDRKSAVANADSYCYYAVNAS